MNFKVTYPCGLTKESEIYRSGTKYDKPSTITIKFIEGLEIYQKFLSEDRWLRKNNNAFDSFQHCCMKADNIMCTITTTVDQRTVWDSLKDFFSN